MSDQIETNWTLKGQYNSSVEQLICESMCIEWINH